VIHQAPTLAGLFQVASKPINKYDLLRLFAQSFKKNVSITEVDGPEAVYRVLDGTKLELAIGYTAPSLERQVNDLC
jgi:dTDP-4-dehydrorhamnose reductase